MSAFNEFENNEAYLQSWLENIKDEPDVLVKAVNMAQKAADYLEESISIEKDIDLQQEMADEEIDSKDNKSFS